MLCVQGLKTELEKVSPTLGRTAIYTRESRINELPRQVHKSLCLFTCCHLYRNILHIDSFHQVPDCAVRSFLLEKGIKPKGEDLTSMLSLYSLSLDQCFDGYGLMATRFCMESLLFFSNTCVFAKKKFSVILLFTES